MTKTLRLFILFLPSMLFAQQITIPRIALMPEMPSPYLMRNWKSVTVGYDSMVFNPSAQGQYLPLIFFRSQGTNYPQHGFFGINTVVGTTRPASTEAINALPALVGASLAGVDKRSQFGSNFVLMAEDYFNLRPAENVYLNSPVTQSGTDWWYETMPNVYFLQLNSLYPHTGDFDNQITLLAGQWLKAVSKMGGSAAPWKVPYMNYRAWKLSTMTPLSGGVTEPEAAGAIAWILYHSYKITGNDDYRVAAEQSMEFLNSFFSNPAYELQLAYGASVAAKMNAELGTRYDIEKMINWCFEVGLLRNWGAFTGTWGGYDIAGLIGENSGNGYAFIMNGFQQLGALLPLLRYDDRFASSIGKWALNAANASRFFYTGFLPDSHQDGWAWSRQYDSSSFIAHEALRQEVNGVTPFATGDAVSGGWGLTNLSLYSSSSVGYLGAMLDTTNVEKILSFDLLKTDFYHDTAYPTYLFYNPYSEQKTITALLPAGARDIYDAVSNTFLCRGAVNSAAINIPARSAVIAVYVPAGGTEVYQAEKLIINNVVVDYHSGQFQGCSAPRIKSLKAVNNRLLLSGQTLVYCTADSTAGDSLSYMWIAQGGTISGNGSTVIYTAPSVPGSFGLQCTVTNQSGCGQVKSVNIEVSQRINHAPVINELKAGQQKLDLGAQFNAYCTASDGDGDSLTYQWYLNGVLAFSGGPSISGRAPQNAGNYYLVCITADNYGGTVADSLLLMVRDMSNYENGSLIAYYPFTGNAADSGGNGYNGFVYQAALTNDRFGIPGRAYMFNGNSAYIQVANNTALNFNSAIALNFWMVPKYFYEREQYPLSHGNWEQRWKISIGGRKLRWTIKTTSGVHDLDSRTVLDLDSLYNITALYDGMAMELYVNGKLDAVTAWTGSLLTSGYDLMFSQHLPGSSSYGFNGILDDIRIYNGPLKPQTIMQFYSSFTGIHKEQDPSTINNFSIKAFPNPANGWITVNIEAGAQASGKVYLYDILGRAVKSIETDNRTALPVTLKFDVTDLASGTYFVVMSRGGKMLSKKIIVLK